MGQFVVVAVVVSNRHFDAISLSSRDEGLAIDFYIWAFLWPVLYLVLSSLAGYFIGRAQQVDVNLYPECRRDTTTAQMNFHCNLNVMFVIKLFSSDS